MISFSSIKGFILVLKIEDNLIWYGTLCTSRTHYYGRGRAGNLRDWVSLNTKIFLRGFINLSRGQGAVPPPLMIFPPSAVLMQISIFLCKLYIFPQSTQRLSDFDGNYQFDKLFWQHFPVKQISWLCLEKVHF